MSLTPRLDKLSKTLSYKILDPVSLGTSDGEQFSSELRLGYINRAYGRMVRMLEDSIDDISKVFPAYYKSIITRDIGAADISNGILELDLENLNPATNESAYEVFDMYITTNANAKIRVNYALPPNFFTIMNGDSNPYYSPDNVNGMLYFTVMSGKLMIAVDALTDSTITTVKLLVKNTVNEFLHNGSHDLKIPSEYQDLLVTIAAQEAMADVGTAQSLQKAQFYAQDIANQFSLIIQRNQIDTFKEEGKA